MTSAGKSKTSRVRRPKNSSSAAAVAVVRRSKPKTPARDVTWEEVLGWLALPWRAQPCELTVVDVWPQTRSDDPRVCGPGGLRVLGEVWLYFEHRPEGLVTWWGCSRQGEVYDFKGLRTALLRAW